MDNPQRSSICRRVSNLSYVPGGPVVIIPSVPPNVLNCYMCTSKLSFGMKLGILGHSCNMGMAASSDVFRLPNPLPETTQRPSCIVLDRRRIGCSGPAEQLH